MKILQVIDSLDSGGAERVCVNLTNSLHQSGYCVSVLTITGIGELASLLLPGIQINCLKRKYKFEIRAMAKLANVLKDYDVVHVHMRYTYQYVRLAAILFFINRKIILHDHYGKIDLDQTVPAFLSTFFKPHFYIGVSKDLTNWGVEKLKITPSHVFLLENIVARVQSSTSKNSTNALNTAVLVANFSRIKNHLFAIQVIEKSKFDLVIYGKVLDAAYFDEVKNYVSKHGLDERIKFIHDEINVQQYLGVYRFGLHTALSESGPLALIEYLAQSTPFLAYETGQVAWKLKDELPDFFLNNFDTNEWKTRIEKVLHINPRRLAEIYMKYFDPEPYLAKCLEIYKLAMSDG